jgi:hypothetical protein
MKEIKILKSVLFALFVALLLYATVISSRRNGNQEPYIRRYPIEIFIEDQVANSFPARELLRPLSEIQRDLEVLILIGDGRSSVIKLRPSGASVRNLDNDILSIKVVAGTFYVNEEETKPTELRGRLALYRQASETLGLPLYIGYLFDESFSLTSFLSLHESVSEAGDFTVVFLGDLSVIQTEEAGANTGGLR